MSEIEIPVYKFAVIKELEGTEEAKIFLPKKGEPNATGWDVRYCSPDKKEIRLRPGQKALLSLGIRGFCSEGWWYQLSPRSSTFHKKALHCLYGTIDERI